jgi:hypothetical protein
MTINSADFGKLLDTIADNLVNASIHNRLHTNLCTASQEYDAEMNQSPVFWQLTINAHAITTILMVCQVYDQHKDSLNLKKLLNIVYANRALFETECFYERIKDRPFADELSKTPRVPDNESLKRDMEYVSEQTNQLVKKLTNFRDTQVAHIDKRHILSDSINSDPILWGEVEELISRGFEIFTTYENLFRATSWSSRMIGEEDYERVLKSVRQAKAK